MSHQGMTRKYLLHDGVHLSKVRLHMFADNLVDFISYFIVNSSAFNNVDWDKAGYNESLDRESNSSNQEFNLNLNPFLDLDDFLKVKETYPNNPLDIHWIN